MKSMIQKTFLVSNALLLILLFSLFALDAKSQPTLNGTFDGAGTWGSSLSSNGSAGWGGAHAEELYATWDKDFIYLGAEVTAASWQTWGFSIDTGAGGSSSEPYGHQLLFNHTNVPNYVFRGGFSTSGYTNQLVSWNGTGWDFSGALATSEYGVSESFVEVRIARSSLNHPEIIRVQFFITGNNSGEHGSFSSLPTDNQATGWNVSNNKTSLSNDETVTVAIGSTSDGNWNNTATWNGGSVPTSTDAVILNNTVTLNTTASLPYLVLKSSSSLNLSDQTLTISDGGALINDGGTFTAGTGKVAFDGAATVTGSVSFNNVDISGGVNFGSSSTVNGELKLLAGGFVDTNKPTYGSSSTLTYETGGSYGAGTEWPTGAGGAPHNVKIVNSSVNFGDSGSERFVLGGLTIESGGILALSTAIGGDLRIRGNWSNSGTFTANGRAVFFDGSSPQTITNTTDAAISIPYTFVQNDVTANSNMTVGNTLDIAADKTLTILSGNALITPSGGVNYNTFGKIEFQRELTSPNYGSLPEGETGHWVGLSSPINGANFAGSGGFLEEIWTQGFTGADDTNGDPNIIVFDPSVPGFTAPSSNTITTGQGFAAYLYKNKDRDNDGTAVDYTTPFAVSGSENTFSSGSHTFTLSTNGNGWNFLGNPFGASLEWQADGDWGTGNWTANAALGHNFIYIWNPSTGKYKVSNGGDDTDDDIEGVLSADDSKIAPFQAFWVKSTGTATSLTVSEAARTITSPNAGLFNEDDNSGENTISSTPVLSLTLELEDEMSSITAFRFGESYSTLFTENDAYYLSPFGRSFAYLFSYMDDTPALLKSLPVQSEEPIVVPLSVGGYSDLNYYSGEATLTRSQFDNIPASWDVKLIDSHTNTEIDLQTMESYSFTLTPSNKSTGALSMFDLMAEGSPVINTALTNPNKAVTRFSLLINNAVPTSIDPVDELPVSVALAQNYPNPFNPATSIRFELPEAQSVMLEVFDMSGRQIATLASGVHQAGSHEVKFDASDLSSGVYLYRLQTAAGTLTRKFTLLK